MRIMWYLSWIMVIFGIVFMAMFAVQIYHQPWNGIFVLYVAISFTVCALGSSLIILMARQEKTVLPEDSKSIRRQLVSDKHQKYYEDLLYKGLNWRTALNQTFAKFEDSERVRGK